MADETAASEPRGSQSSPDKPTEPTYSSEELQEMARAHLDASPHEVAGALSGLRRSTHTLDQARSALEKFRKHEDETEHHPYPGDGSEEDGE